jgi:hypothetical protein
MLALQTGGKVAADEPGTSGDEDVHGWAAMRSTMR